MKKYKLICAILGLVCTGSCSSFSDTDIRIKHFVGFEAEPSIKTEQSIHFYDTLNTFKEKEFLSLNDMSYLFSLLDLNGEASRYKFKGDIFPSSSVAIGANFLNINPSKGNIIKYSSLEELYIVNKINENQALKVFNTSVDEICSVSIIIYHKSKATYVDIKDSFGIYLGEQDSMSPCKNKGNDELNIIAKLPLDVKRNDINNARSLANLLNSIKTKYRLNNSEIGKMIAMSNINVGTKELKYTEPYQTNNLTVFHDGYQLANYIRDEQITRASDSSPYMIIFSTNSNSETVLLGSTKLTHSNDLKLIVHKLGTSYIYDINDMKRKVISK